MDFAFDLQTIARETLSAHDHSATLIPFTSRYAWFDIDRAYEAARLIHESRVANGAVPVGRKIGFTNPEMWAVYGVQQPVWAHVYDRTVVQSSDPVIHCDISRLVEPKIEPEIVLYFHSTPTTNDPDEILGCIDWIAHGMEIVQSHFPGWKFQAADTVVDFGMHAQLLVGEPRYVRTLGPDLASQLKQFTVTLSCDGTVRETGRGSNVLGSPLAAMSHLISVLASQPGHSTIQAGELITTGTITKAYSVQAGETWSTSFEGLALPGMNVVFERSS